MSVLVVMLVLYLVERDGFSEYVEPKVEERDEN